MCKKLFFLISFVLALGLAGYASAAVDANIPAASTPPVIDGIKDDAWSASEKHPISYTVKGGFSPSESPADLSGSWWALWDSNYLYVFVDINDSNLCNNSAGESWNNDSVEIFIDIGNDKLKAMGPDDYQYRVAWNADPNVKGLEEKRHSPASVTDVNFVVLTKGVGGEAGGQGTGYTLEIRFPWTTLNVSGRPDVVGLGKLLGFDVMVNDNDRGYRETQLAWHDATGDAWRNPSLIGTVQLAPGLSKSKAYKPNPRPGNTGVPSGPSK
ncbi:MAG: CBM9 family sugar-binding protein [Sedimentisphaerales bacterium]